MKKERLRQLGNEMKKNGESITISFRLMIIMVLSMLGNIFKCRQFITGFTGSALGRQSYGKTAPACGQTAAIFCRRQNSFQGAGSHCLKWVRTGVPDIPEFLQRIKAGECLGVDGRTVSASSG